MAAASGGCRASASTESLNTLPSAARALLRNMRVWSQYTFSPVLTFSRSFVSHQNTDKKWRKAGEQRENLRNRLYIHVSRMFLAFSRDSLENVERPLDIALLPLVTE
ncbi:hypothetical protein JYU34_018077 [Plutella xylostella]|uniref:Uncharacterized protein n=1 Tax=Plutella xylostella TaxID=51655 RepID=A0ABQ7PZY2_PLUXY|nr:hypothetical protein JYU34_018077 [Plutella xylostella]